MNANRTLSSNVGLTPQTLFAQCTENLGSNRFFFIHDVLYIMCDDLGMAKTYHEQQVNP